MSSIGFVFVYFLIPSTNMIENVLISPDILFSHFHYMALLLVMLPTKVYLSYSFFLEMLVLARMLIILCTRTIVFTTIHKKMHDMGHFLSFFLASTTRVCVIFPLQKLIKFPAVDLVNSASDINVLYS